MTQPFKRRNNPPGQAKGAPYPLPLRNSWWRLSLIKVIPSPSFFVILAPIWIAGCPMSTNPSTEIGIEPVYLDEYMPLVVGNRWEWTLYLTESPDASQETPHAQPLTVPLSIEVISEVSDGLHSIFELQLEAPWYIMLALRILDAGDGLVYLAKLDDGIHITFSSEASQSLPDTKPGTESWHRLPIDYDIRNRVVQTNWKSDEFWLRYTNGLLDSITPPHINSPVWPLFLNGDEEAVAMETSDDSFTWNPTTAIFVIDIGPVYFRTPLGSIYLHDARLTPLTETQEVFVPDESGLSDLE